MINSILVKYSNAYRILSIHFKKYEIKITVELGFKNFFCQSHIGS